MICNLKLKLFILITLVDFAELLTDFSYTNFAVGLSNVDALDRLRVHLNIILLFILSNFRTMQVRADNTSVGPSCLTKAFIVTHLVLHGAPVLTVYRG